MPTGYALNGEQRSDSDNGVIAAISNIARTLIAMYASLDAAVTTFEEYERLRLRATGTLMTTLPDIENTLMRRMVSARTVFGDVCKQLDKGTYVIPGGAKWADKHGTERMTAKLVSSPPSPLVQFSSMSGATNVSVSALLAQRRSAFIGTMLADIATLVRRDVSEFFASVAHAACSDARVISQKAVILRGFIAIMMKFAVELGEFRAQISPQSIARIGVQVWEAPPKISIPSIDSSRTMLGIAATAHVVDVLPMLTGVRGIVFEKARDMELGGDCVQTVRLVALATDAAISVARMYVRDREEFVIQNARARVSIDGGDIQNEVDMRSISMATKAAELFAQTRGDLLEMHAAILSTVITTALDTTVSSLSVFTLNVRSAPNIGALLTRIDEVIAAVSVAAVIKTE